MGQFGQMMSFVYLFLTPGNLSGISFQTPLRTGGLGRFDWRPGQGTSSAINCRFRERNQIEIETFRSQRKEVKEQMESHLGLVFFFAWPEAVSSHQVTHFSPLPRPEDSFARESQRSLESP